MNTSHLSSARVLAIARYRWSRKRRASPQGRLTMVRSLSCERARRREGSWQHYATAPSSSPCLRAPCLVSPSYTTSPSSDWERERGEERAREMDLGFRAAASRCFVASRSAQRLLHRQDWSGHGQTLAGPGWRFHMSTWAGPESYGSGRNENEQ